MKLYYKAGACSLATDIILREAGLSFDMEQVDLATKKTDTGADFFKVNPKGYIPTLVTDDGTVMTEGVAIALAVAAMAPSKGLAPAAGTADYFKLVEWMVFIATELHKSAGALFNPAMPDEGKAVVKGLLGRRMDYMNQALGNGPFVMGQQFTIADAYLFTVFSWMGYVQVDTSAWANLKAHTQRVGARPAVQAALKAEGLV